MSTQEATQLLECDLCGNKFKTPQALGLHKAKAHGIRGTSDKTLQRDRRKESLETSQPTGPPDEIVSTNGSADEAPEASEEPQEVPQEAPQEVDPVIAAEMAEITARLERMLDEKRIERDRLQSDLAKVTKQVQTFERMLRIADPNAVPPAIAKPVGTVTKRNRRNKARVSDETKEHIFQALQRIREGRAIDIANQAARSESSVAEAIKALRDEGRVRLLRAEQRGRGMPSPIYGVAEVDG